MAGIDQTTDKLFKIAVVEKLDPNCKLLQFLSSKLNSIWICKLFNEIFDQPFVKDDLFDILGLLE
jgi:hypothetical protein